MSQDEVATIKAYKGMKQFIPLCWALEHVRALLAREGDSHPDISRELIAHRFTDVTWAFRNHASQIINMVKQPVPVGLASLRGSSPSRSYATSHLGWTQ